ncbi:hypothetical protein G6011_03182 [Alternaria panax]|uniref:Cytochrome P450 monooxygenase n=1 Tax=Alternaria panax TaxID=48097 RepID=A0AAD4NSH5_9PLEO|nr:hypothetical protein G6011_03182 [Alternaria panax]
MLPEVYHMKSNKSNFYDSTLNEASNSCFSEKHHVAHIAARRSLAHAYSMTNVKALEPQIQRVIDLWVTRLCTHEDKPFVLSDRVLWLAFDVLGVMVFGEPFGFVEEWTDIRAMLERSSKSTTSGRYLEYYNLIPTLSFLVRKTRIGKSLFLPWPTDQVGLGVIKAERDAGWVRYFEQKPVASPHCLLSQILDKRTNPKQDPFMSDDRVKNELLIAILAGTTTTTRVLNAALLNIAVREECSAKLREEIFAQPQFDCEVNYEYSGSLSYLGACIKEAFRLSASPTQFPRVVDHSRNVELNGVRLSPGTVVSSSSYVISRNEELYGGQLEEFLPERWVEATEETTKARRKYDFRFGYGARTCLGKNLVEVEIHNAVFEVFRRANVRVHDLQKAIVSVELREVSCT